MHIRQNLDLVTDLFFVFLFFPFLSLFFSLSFLFIASFVAPLIAFLSRGIFFPLTFQERIKFNLQRVVGE